MIVYYDIFSLSIGFIAQITNMSSKSVGVTSHFSEIRLKSKMSLTDGCAIFRWVIGSVLDQKKNKNQKKIKISVGVTAV